MSASAPPPSNEGLYYEACLPLRWRPLEESTAAAGSGTCHDEANADFLRALAVLQEHASEHSEETAELAHEIRRLEVKLDLALGMLGQILARQLALPEPVPLRLAASYIEWTSPPGTPSLPLPGGRVCLELYLVPEYPRPLFFPGTVESVQTCPEGGLRVRVRFAPLSETLQDWLERTIFCYHRRLVAHSRHACSS